MKTCNLDNEHRRPYIIYFSAVPKVYNTPCWPTGKYKWLVFIFFIFFFVYNALLVTVVLVLNWLRHKCKIFSYSILQQSYNLGVGIICWPVSNSCKLCYHGNKVTLYNKYQCFFYPWNSLNKKGFVYIANCFQCPKSLFPLVSFC